MCHVYGFDSYRIDSRRRVVGSLEPWCRLSAHFGRERRTPPCCAVSRLILYMYVHVHVNVHVYVYVTPVKLFLQAFCWITRAGKAEFLPLSAGDDTMLCRRPFQQPANTCCRRRRLSSVVSVEGPRGRRNWLSANFSRERRTPPCCTNVYNVHIAGEASSCQRVSVAGPHGPAYTHTQTQSYWGMWKCYVTYLLTAAWNSNTVEYDHFSTVCG